MKQFLISIFLLLILTVSDTVTAQQNFNLHNPYVSNSEIHWLRQKEINLFEKPIVDDLFTSNIRKTIDYRDNYNNKKSGHIAAVTATAFAYIVGITGLILSGDSAGQSESRRNLAPVYWGSIGLGIGGTIWSLGLNNDKKIARSEYEQQLEITRDQYNILSGG